MTVLQKLCTYPLQSGVAKQVYYIQHLLTNKRIYKYSDEGFYVYTHPPTLEAELTSFDLRSVPSGPTHRLQWTERYELFHMYSNEDET